ncbi:HAD family hydrolase [Virgibacillus profundi]|uniref:HAD family hydrolase n=1 Tax=Virgibacillus profundi TaxID=2024555 RepID=A0A2A2IG65_9BACI|nr:HAD family hydrolase [Virgibacillus profundi]PAV30358.1 HAD family hydrolase [Virgibacillus profundi]PXY54530.1 HAD family hydrolase [Virgibacillus profundi]
MNKHYKQVRDFHEAFGHEQANTPTEIDYSTALNRAIWTGEELVEFLYATVDGNKEEFSRTLNEFHKGLDKAAVKTIEKNPDVDNKLVAQMDALTDVSYFNYGSFAVAGVDPEPLFDIVQDANMGKLWEDGKPRYREEDNKIQKPPYWEFLYAPEAKLEAEIERQSK